MLSPAALIVCAVIFFWLLKQFDKIYADKSPSKIKLVLVIAVITFITAIIGLIIT
jgi:hypothetical protein